MNLQTIRADIDFLDLFVVDQLHEFVVTDPGRRLRPPVHHIADHNQCDHGRKEHDHQILAVGPFASISLLVIAAPAAAAVSSAVVTVVVVTLEAAACAVFLMEKISKHSNTLSFTASPEARYGLRLRTHYFLCFLALFF